MQLCVNFSYQIKNRIFFLDHENFGYNLTFSAVICENTFAFIETFNPAAAQEPVGVSHSNSRTGICNLLGNFLSLHFTLNTGALGDPGLPFYSNLITCWLIKSD